MKPRTYDFICHISNDKLELSWAKLSPYFGHYFELHLMLSSFLMAIWLCQWLELEIDFSLHRQKEILYQIFVLFSNLCIFNLILLLNQWTENTLVYTVIDDKLFFSTFASLLLHHGHSFDVYEKFVSLTLVILMMIVASINFFEISLIIIHY